MKSIFYLQSIAFICVVYLMIACSSGSSSSDISPSEIPLEGLSLPVNKAQQVSFIDIDMSMGKLAGDILIIKASDESDISGYRIRWGDSDHCSLNDETIISAISATGNDIVFNLIENTEIPRGATSFVVYTFNDAGEMANCDNTSLDFVDLPQSNGNSGVDNELVLDWDEQQNNYQQGERQVPLLESLPGAPIALYMDFGGGFYYHSLCSYFDDPDTYDPENIEALDGMGVKFGDGQEFTMTQRNTIVLAWRRTAEYFAMFDINVTTDHEAAKVANAYAWQLITDSSTAGLATGCYQAIHSDPPGGVAYTGANRIEIDDDNKSRTVASEFGHLLDLHHQGVCDPSDPDAEDSGWVKLRNWDQFDEVQGAIMGSGKGLVNGWRYGADDSNNLCIANSQNDTEIISAIILQFGQDFGSYSGDGYRQDDHSDSFNNPTLIKKGIEINGVIEVGGDDDYFQLNWDGGAINLTVSRMGESSVDLRLRVYNADKNTLADINSDRTTIESVSFSDLSASTYYIRVESISSSDEVGESGAYILKVE